MVKNGLSKATAQRMPGYLRFLKEKNNEGKQYISSVAIAKYMKLSAICVKKDLGFATSSAGKPKIGFSIKCLISDIERVLGFDTVTKAVLVGVGQLGRALLSYNGFANYGLNIVAAFDKNPVVLGTAFNGIITYDINFMEEFVKSHGVSLGIIAVPVKFAQDACDVIVKSGVRAVWNFAPTVLNVPENVVVKNEDMAESLAVLSSTLKAMLADEIKTPD